VFRTSAVLAAGTVVAAVVFAALSAGSQAAQTSSLWDAGTWVAWPRASSVRVHAEPGSPRVVARVARRTEFDNPASLAVVDVRGGWAEVISTRLGNEQRGYVRVSRVRLTHTPMVLEVDLSRRQLRVWRAGNMLREVRVAIGAAISPTPTGRFAVTDKLYGFNPAAYGCCILALSAHQEQLAPGWPGGDRIAVHAGGPVGSASSNGCLEATIDDMRWLMGRIPLGTQIVIHP
jgi:lipoprotein-anchoring transpeptidase ErfK/SrfK